MRLDIGIVIAGLLATGCGDCTRGDVPRVEDASSLGSATLSVEELVDARMERIQRLRTSCVPEHWPTLVLMATNRYDWGDDLALRHARAAEDVQCQARGALLYLNDFLFQEAKRNIGVLRRVASAFAKRDVITALDDAISGRIRLPPGCSNPDDLASVVEFAPLQELRPAIAAHASDYVRDRLLSTLDHAQDYEPGPRAAQLEQWAAELSPDGFARVLEAIAPDHVWNHGALTEAERRQIEDRALDLIRWLGALVNFDAPKSDCDRSLADAVSDGPLGVLVLSRLDHPNPAIRMALLDVLASVPATGSRAAVAKLETDDPDPGVRKTATSTLTWIDRGGRTRRVNAPH